VEVDGVRHQLAWGTHFFDVEPGTHEVRVSVVVKPTLELSGEFGAHRITVEVVPGHTSVIRYFGAATYWTSGMMSAEIPSGEM
jgi:hypothetical protein